MREYIERRGESFYVAGTRVSLASVVHHFRLGASPETLLLKFPALASLGTVYGAIAFYLDNQAMVEAFMTSQEQQWKDFEDSADAPPRGLSRGVEHILPSG
jgi:uncharacterized protein (DUF433 family)